MDAFYTFSKPPDMFRCDYIFIVCKIHEDKSITLIFNEP